MVPKCTLWNRFNGTLTGIFYKRVPSGAHSGTGWTTFSRVVPPPCPSSPPPPLAELPAGPLPCPASWVAGIAAWFRGRHLLSVLHFLLGDAWPSLPSRPPELQEFPLVASALEATAFNWDEELGHTSSSGQWHHFGCCTVNSMWPCWVAAGDLLPGAGIGHSVGLAPAASRSSPSA